MMLISNKTNNYLTKLKIMECNDINKKDQNNYSYLQLAIINKSSDDIILLLLEKEIDFNVLDENNNNILHLLIKYFNDNWYQFSDIFNIFKIFDNKHFNHKNKDGNTPLHFAFMYNLRNKYIKLLITKENINFLNNLNKSPLEILIETENENNSNNYELFFKVFINSIDNYYNILKIIIKYNNLNYLKYILNLRYNDLITNKEKLNSDKFSFNKKDEEGNTLLHYSILYNSSYKIILHLLHSSFVAYNHQNNEGDTILHLAVKKKYNKENIKIVNLLVNYCNKNLLNNHNQNALDILNLHKHGIFIGSLKALF